MFVAPVFMIIFAVLCAFGPYLLSLPKLKDEEIMSSLDYIGGGIVEVFLYTVVFLCSNFLGLVLYNAAADKNPTKLSPISNLEFWIVLAIIMLGAVAPTYLFVKQLNLLKTADKDQLDAGIKVPVQKTESQKSSQLCDTISHQIPQLTKLSWPTYDNLPARVARELDVIYVLWSNQQGRAHTVENEYLLEKIVTDYIPSSMALYLPFISSERKMESAARAALFSQLQIIKGHLQQLSESAFSQQMRDVNAQTDFLKHRFPIK